MEEGRWLEMDREGDMSMENLGSRAKHERWALNGSDSAIGSQNLCRWCPPTHLLPPVCSGSPCHG